MTSEIRANTLKNRVGLGTVSFTNTGPVISGIVTASSGIDIPAMQKISLGDPTGAHKLEIYHNTVGSSYHYIRSTSSTNHLILEAPSIGPWTESFVVRNKSNTQNKFRIHSDGQTFLYYNNQEKFKTTSTGAEITGTLVATTFDGNVTGNISGGTVAGSTGTFSGDVSITDKIIHTDDTNTAIRFPANDTISFETGGSERLRIKSNGQIVLGSDGSNSELTFSQDGSTGVILNSTTTGFGGYNTFTINSASFVHRYGSNERFRISSTYAKIGINTSTFDTNGSQIKIEGRGTGTTSPPYLQIKGVGNGALHSYVDLIATSDSNAGSAYRGLGIVMYDEPTNIEWFSGRPYAGSDKFIISRKASPSYRTESGEVANELIRISSEGYVTKPKHPSFCARHQNGSGFSGDIIVLTRISTSWDVWNTGGHYSTSTGKFTAPVSGVYYFEGQLMTTGHSNGDNIQDMFSLESNRGRITYVRQRESYFSTSTNANGYYTNSCGSSVKLSSGDTVWLQRNSGQNWGYSNRYYSYFTGWLIG